MVVLVAAVAEGLILDRLERRAAPMVNDVSGNKTNIFRHLVQCFSLFYFYFFNIYFYLLIWLSGLSCSMQDLFSCSMKTL